jgi:hypothetical protein
MNARPHTFTDDLDDVVVPILRTKTPAEKIAMIASGDRVVRMLEAAGLRLRHPDWTEEQIRQTIVNRRLHGAG